MRLTFLDHLLIATFTALLFLMVLLFLHSHPSVLAPFEVPQAMSGELDGTGGSLAPLAGEEDGEPVVDLWEWETDIGSVTAPREPDVDVDSITAPDSVAITGLPPTDCGEACHRPDTPGAPRFWSLEAEEGYCATWANTAMRIAEGRDLGIDPQTAMAEIRMHVASPEAAVKGIGLVGQVYGPDSGLTPTQVRMYQYTACSLANGGGA